MPLAVSWTKHQETNISPKYTSTNLENLENSTDSTLEGCTSPKTLIITHIPQTFEASTGHNCHSGGTPKCDQIFIIQGRSTQKNQATRSQKIPLKNNTSTDLIWYVCHYVCHRLSYQLWRFWKIQQIFNKSDWYFVDYIITLFTTNRPLFSARNKFKIRDC